MFDLSFLKKVFKFFNLFNIYIYIKYFLGTNVFELIECRHPVIEQAPNIQFIPNDIKLGNLKFVVLTGANMGGKSTYLRSSALAVLMAQMGCFVACTSAKFSLIDGIFTR